MIKQENLIFIEKALQFPEVISLVSKASERMWHKLNDVTSFEHTCYRNIGKALSEEKVRSVGGITTRIIARAEAWHIKNRGIDEEVEIKSIESLAGLDDEGNERSFEIVDDLADIERDLIREETKKENVALLAKDDERKLAILEAWINGYHNAKELSGVLANTFGGKAESHRKSIQRFEIECKKRLNVA